MEVKETGACGIAEREFAIELNETEIAKVYKMLLAAKDGTKDFDADMLEDLLGNMEHIVGPSIAQS